MGVVRRRVEKVKLNLPESGNGTPDILNEIRWNLDWMLSMQDDDGGVWHKQTSEHFCDFIMPEKDDLMSYVIGTGKEPFKSSCATGDFAAVMAIAARVYRPFDAALCGPVSARGAAGMGLAGEESGRVVSQPAGRSTGEYGDGHCGDEHLWASAELFRTTDDEHYERYFLEHYGRLPKVDRPDGPPIVGQRRGAGIVDVRAGARR